MRIACYCRVSTEKESQVLSLENQKLFFKEYAKKNNFEVYKIYADWGISGTKLKNRTEFNNLMKDASKHMFDLVVVKDVSRFARNTVDLLQSIRALKELDINVNFITANMTSMGDSEFVLTVFGALAQEESNNISKRVKFAKKLNAEKGRVPNIVYGYDKIKGDYFNLNINDKEADVVKQIFDLYINNYGCTRISMFLNGQGFKTKRGCQFSVNAIERIIKNGIYIGKIINRKQEVENFLTGKRKDLDEQQWFVTDKPELRIVSDEIFNKANSIYAKASIRMKNHPITTQRNTSKYILSGLLKCSECGYGFKRFAKEKGHKATYWKCKGRNAQGSEYCPNLTKIYENDMLKIIQENFNSIIEDKEIFTKNIYKKYKDKYSDVLNDVSFYKKELKEKEKRKESFIEMYQNEIITMDDLKKRTLSLNDEIDNLQKTIYSAESVENNKDIKKEINLFFDNIQKCSTKMTNQNLKSIFDYILISPNDEVEIHYKLLENLN